MQNFTFVCVRMYVYTYIHTCIIVMTEIMCLLCPALEYHNYFISLSVLSKVHTLDAYFCYM